ncbi:hypothetical protein MNB_SM-7-746 [hydrothermal vent metagenome]|uniref:Uncharacterized protein n=1 Tax=hydrothermal vent metagenome TaxID=652676 RepID=A0A1W1C3R9_9ZZZZ
MATVTVRKNFKFDKELVEKVGALLYEKDLNFTQLITHYFQAIVKEPELVDIVEKKSKQRSGKFIGMLDGVVEKSDYKEMRKSYHEDHA